MLNTLEANDPGGVHHCVRLKEWFEYRHHVCMVFERLGLSLYDFLRKNSYKPFHIELVRPAAAAFHRPQVFLGWDLHFTCLDRASSLLSSHRATYPALETHARAARGLAAEAPPVFAPQECFWHSPAQVYISNQDHGRHCVRIHGLWGLILMQSDKGRRLQAGERLLWPSGCLMRR